MKKQKISEMINKMEEDLQSLKNSLQDNNKKTVKALPKAIKSNIYIYETNDNEIEATKKDNKSLSKKGIKPSSEKKTDNSTILGEKIKALSKLYQEEKEESGLKWNEFVKENFYRV